MTSATAITEVFGDGLKLTAVALQYPRPIATAKLAVADYTVASRTVTKVYANTSPALAESGVDGNYVIVELSTSDAAAALSPSPGGSGGPGGSAGASASTSAGMTSGAPSGSASSSGATTGQGGGAAGGMSFGLVAANKPAKASVAQARPVTAVDGTTFPVSTASVATNKVSNLIVDDFTQHEFTDPATKKTIKYNLFQPKGYDPTKSYPLVLFIHDAGVLSEVTTTTLTQGLGAVCWASPEDQAQRPAFVLAPQFDTASGDGGSGDTSMVDATVALVNSVASSYSIDKNRLYATGQSLGGIMTISMLITHPNLFAAVFLVACQASDVSKVAPMASDTMWVVVSEGDQRAYPGQNQIMTVLAKDGAKISRAVWDGRSTAEAFAADVAAMEAKKTPINYTALKKGTVVPTGETDDAGSNHTNTWRIAYTIEGIRDWIFQQHK